MAMQKRYKIEATPSIVWADVTDYNPTSGTAFQGTRTHQIDLTGLPAADYRQGVKADFGMGTERVHPLWLARGSIEPAAAPTAAGTYTLLMGWSNSATAGVDNVANLAGTDAVYNAYGAADTDATEAILQLDEIGSITVSADADVHCGFFGADFFKPLMRYGAPVLRNNTSAALAADAVEMSIQLFRVFELEVI